MSSILNRTQTLVETAERCLMPNYGTRDTAIVRGAGVRMWDAEGTEYLDFLSGIGVNSLGHCHPAVVAAIREQAGTLLHTSNGVLIEPQVRLAEFLCAETGMDRAMFANSGAEVTEAAIKLCRLWAREKHGPDRHRVMVFTNAFHGRTFGAMSASFSAKVRDGFEPLLPGFVFATFNSLEDVDAKWDNTIAGVMVETVQGEGGVRPAEAEFLRGLRQRCTDRRAVLVCDEVQCGMGRSGRRMAYMHAGIEPDAVPLAKALGGGVPIGALLARGEFADVLTRGRHGTTFGGNPLACAAGLAASRLLFDEELLESVGRKGCRLWGHLLGIIERHPELCDHVRGVGLMQGLVLKVDATPVPAVARRHQLFVNATGGNVVRLLPPLIISEEEIDEGAEKLEAALAEYEATLG